MFERSVECSNHMTKTSCMRASSSSTTSRVSVASSTPARHYCHRPTSAPLKRLPSRSLQVIQLVQLIQLLTSSIPTSSTSFASRPIPNQFSLPPGTATKLTKHPPWSKREIYRIILSLGAIFLASGFDFRVLGSWSSSPSPSALFDPGPEPEP